jgi:hypothetical protein
MSIQNSKSQRKLPKPVRRGFHIDGKTLRAMVNEYLDSGMRPTSFVSQSEESNRYEDVDGFLNENVVDIGSLLNG